MILRSARFLLHRASSTVRIVDILLRFPFYEYGFSYLAFESLCSTVAGIPSVTINTNPGTPGPGTPTAIVPLTTSVPVSKIVIGPSSTTTVPAIQGASSLSSTSTASVGGLPLKSTASPNKIIFQWTGTLLALTLGNFLVF